MAFTSMDIWRQPSNIVALQKGLQAPQLSQEITLRLYRIIGLADSVEPVDTWEILDSSLVHLRRYSLKVQVVYCHAKWETIIRVRPRRDTRAWISIEGVMNTGVIPIRMIPTLNKRSRVLWSNLTNNLVYSDRVVCGSHKEDLEWRLELEYLDLGPSYDLWECVEYLVQVLTQHRLGVNLTYPHAYQRIKHKYTGPEPSNEHTGLQVIEQSLDLVRLLANPYPSLEETIKRRDPNLEGIQVLGFILVPLDKPEGRLTDVLM